jgi:multidrug efflux pump subunit AcrB
VLLRTPTDIFPSINIPVVSIIWSYTGLSAKEIEQRMIFTHERAPHDHGQQHRAHRVHVLRWRGRDQGVLPTGTSPDAGVAQVTAVSQTILRQLPPGTTPPLVIQYNASTVPILQYGISSKTMNEQQIQDVSLNQIRVGLISVPGAGVPLPYGGKQRLVSVDLDMRALESNNLSSQDVVAAISNQNIVFPSGNAKIGAEAVSGGREHEPGAHRLSQRTADQNRGWRGHPGEGRGARARRQRSASKTSSARMACAAH